MEKLIIVEDVIAALRKHDMNVIYLNHVYSNGIDIECRRARVNFNKSLLRLDDLLPGYCAHNRQHYIGQIEADESWISANV